METLKLKIFDLLIDNITVSEFENWLYYLEFLKNELKENSLIFNIVNINYKQINPKSLLMNIASDLFKKDDLILMKIERNCNMIVRSNTTKDYEKYVLNIIENYDYDIEFDSYWSFYCFYYSIDGYEPNNYSNRCLKKLNLEVLEYSKTLSERLKNCKSINEKKKMLSQEKQLKQKAVCFFQKTLILRIKG